MRIVALEEHFSLPMIHGQTGGAGPKLTVANDENMPAVVQSVTYLIPLRYFLVIVRGIFLKGTGFDILWPQFLALAIWGVSALTLAAMRSRKTA